MLTHLEQSQPSCAGVNFHRKQTFPSDLLCQGCFKTSPWSQNCWFVVGQFSRGVLLLWIQAWSDLEPKFADEVSQLWKIQVQHLEWRKILGPSAATLGAAPESQRIFSKAVTRAESELEMFRYKLDRRGIKPQLNQLQKAVKSSRCWIQALTFPESCFFGKSEQQSTELLEVQLDDFVPFQL